MTLAPRRSLRTQLVLWNVAALALLFAALGGVVRYAVQSTILASVDRELARRAGPPGDGPPPGFPGGQDGPPNGSDGPGGFRGGQNDAPGGPFGGPGPPPGDQYHPIRFDLSGRPFRAFDRRPAGTPKPSRVPRRGRRSIPM